ncbi:MAG: GatB/YqeY domain-containing protein [Deltaproteobacteria bacterium]|nr:GatB/YqeY domain-containing protein [Deltaproteobacteria bacterium]
MSLEETIAQDLKEAMKARDEVRISCLRMLKTAIKNKQVEKGDKLQDSDVQTILSSLIRKGQEAVHEYKKGEREDLATKEEQEIKIFYGYLPKQLSSEEIEGIIKDIITELSAHSMKDLGNVMKVAMAKMSGKAQGREVSEIARKLLNSHS